MNPQSFIDREADLYELDLRRRDARGTFLIGIPVLLLGIGLLVGWVVVLALLTELLPSERIRTGLLYAGLVLVALGGGTVVQGFRKHRDWRERRRALGGG